MVDLLLVTSESCNGLLGCVRSKRRPQEEGVIIGTSDGEFGLSCRELLVAGESEFLSCDSGEKGKSPRREACESQPHLQHPMRGPCPSDRKVQCEG